MSEAFSKLPALCFSKTDQGVLVDPQGQMIYTTDQIADELLYRPDLNIGNFYVADCREYEKSLKALMADFPRPRIYDVTDLDLETEEFDRKKQSQWLMPEEYQNLDILNWMLSEVSSDQERDRIRQEFELYQKHDLVNLLRLLKYLTDVFRKNKIIQGVGRGSSVSSYCLYIIGIHKIDSIKYQLDITDFLR